MAKNLKDLPFSIDAEKAVIGAALIDSESAIEILAKLDRPEYFYSEKHQLIYRAIANVKNQGLAIDAISVASELDNMKVLEKIGGSDYLLDCSNSMVALSSLKSYIDIVQKFGTLRFMLKTIREIDEEYLAENVSIENIDDFLTVAETKFKESLDTRKVSEFSKVDTIAKEMQERLTNIKERSDDYIVGVTTGYKRLDAITDGFKKGEVTILAGRPSLGKTALALNFAYNASTRGNCAVAIFSLEMGYVDLFDRLVSSRSGVDCKRIQRGQLSNGADRASVSSAIKEVGSTNIYIDDSNGAKINDIVAKSRNLLKSLEARHEKLGLVVIDYLGLISIPGLKANDSRQEEVRKLSLRIKQMAKELEVPVLVLSQFSRDVEKRGDKPKMSDLRDSGNLEQDADVILLLHRDDYQKESKSTGNSAQDKYGDKKPKQLSYSQRYEYLSEKKQISDGATISATVGESNNTSLVEVIVAKNRNGSTGSTFLLFHKNIQRFDALTEETEKKIRDFSNEFSDL